MFNFCARDEHTGDESVDCTEEYQMCRRSDSRAMPAIPNLPLLPFLALLTNAQLTI